MTKYESRHEPNIGKLLSEEESGTTEEFGTQGAFLITKQIISNKNFLSFVIMNLFQVREIIHKKYCSY